MAEHRREVAARHLADRSPRRVPDRTRRPRRTAAIGREPDEAAAHTRLSFGERGESAKMWREPGMTLEKVKSARLAEAEKAAEILGGDIEFSIIHREATDAELAFMRARGEVSRVATLRAMALHRDQTALIETVRGVGYRFLPAVRPA